MAYWKHLSVFPLPRRQTASSSTSHKEPIILGASYEPLIHTGNFKDTNWDAVHIPRCSMSWGFGSCRYLCVHPPPLGTTSKCPNPHLLLFIRQRMAQSFAYLFSDPFSQTTVFLKLFASWLTSWWVWPRAGLGRRLDGRDKDLVSVFLSIHIYLYIARTCAHTRTHTLALLVFPTCHQLLRQALLASFAFSIVLEGTITLTWRW